MKKEKWVFDFNSGTIINADDKTDCVVEYEHLTKERAATISAAPELLRALKMLLELTETYCDEGPPDEGYPSTLLSTARYSAEEAIAKAEGKQGDDDAA